ncbi:acetyltransferase (GNAT) family protein [Stackebrandtia albiflava]|uniref:Acetyltransferase (GNAT) family protein n=1 Tax=Stackebrandtia albiflava TaxID=406432 RepID=A0A562URC5_9ACTN|nr:GNAT family N-acetyltransferase [Stackebrandtia albiflava]TWJ08161.1 acetyltransferase (GNAT) family protein [Stackebrandtia albiflava]
MTVTIALEPVDSADGVALVRACFADIIGRALGRPVTATELDAALAADPADGLSAPTGWFAVARSAGEPAGCVGVKRVSDDTGELQRFFVAPAFRGAGTGSALLAFAEQTARERGLSVLRLDTRSDLVEAGRRFAARGFTPVTPFNTDPHVDRWLAKRLT